jgi:hypothetical protein
LVAVSDKQINQLLTGHQHSVFIVVPSKRRLIQASSLEVAGGALSLSGRLSHSHSERAQGFREGSGGGFPPIVAMRDLSLQMAHSYSSML